MPNRKKYHMPDDQEVAPHIYRMPGGHTYNYPIGYSSVKRLVKSLLTLVEATGMNSSQMKAVKSLVNQTTYGWFEDVQENAKTAAPASGHRPMRVQDESADLPGEGRKRNYRWYPARFFSDAGNPSIVRLIGDGLDDVLMEVEDISDYADSGQCSGDHSYRIKWVGPTTEDMKPNERQREFMWAALEHALTTAPPFFPPDEDDDETIESIARVYGREVADDVMAGEYEGP